MNRWLVAACLLLAGFALLSAPLFVHAATSITPLQPSGGLTDPFQGTCASGTGTCHTEQSVIGTLFGKIIQIATLLAGILAVLFIVYNGIMYVLSAGDAAKMKTARGNILSVLLGIIIIVAAYSIIRFAQTLGGFLNGL